MWRALQRAAKRTLELLKSKLSATTARGRWSEVHASSLWGSLAYRLYTPAASPPRDGLPLVVMLHGCKQDAESFAAGTRMNRLADRQHFMVLYPEQSRAANPLRCWNWFAFNSGISQGEAARIAQLVMEIRDRYAIDHRRVYIMGMSAGAAMARVICIHFPQLFAAAALHSGLMYRAATSATHVLAVMRTGSNASPDVAAGEALRIMGAEFRIVPTLLIHGDQDEVVQPINAQQHVEQFMAMATLSDTTLESADEVRSRKGGRHCRTQDFTQNSQLILRQCIIEGLGHAWSGGEERYAFNDASGPSASELAWEFVSEFQQDASNASVTESPSRLSL